MILNFQLILVPDEQSILEDVTETGLSLALGIIASYLEENGIQIRMEDLNKRFGKRKFSKAEIELISSIYDGNQIHEYLNGESNPVLDQVAELFLHNIVLDSDAYGISIGADFSMMQIHLGFILASYLKRRSRKRVFVGGNNVSYLYIFKDFYQDLLTAAVKNLDFIVKGPGERVIYEIIQGLNNGQTSFSNAAGLMRLVDGQITCNKEKDPIIIRPNWDGLDINEYRYPFMNNQRENENIYYRFPISLTNKIIEFNSRTITERKLFIPYIFNYNCTYKCAFCTQSDMDRSGFIVGEIKSVIDDIEALSKKYNSNYFYFLNNYFPSSTQYIQEFHAELKRRNIEIYWSDCGRVNGLTRGKLQLLYEAGCRKLVFGFESGSDKILELIDKRLKKDELVQVLKWCKEIGIWADLEVIIGLPYEREEEFMETYNFINEHRSLINNFWLNEYFVVPNSLIGRYPENYGITLLKDRFTYDEIMDRNKSGFVNRNYINLTANARLWGFNEINEGDFRSYDQMKIENKDKMDRLAYLRNPEFNRLFDFYNKILAIRKNNCFERSTKND